MEKIRYNELAEYVYWRLLQIDNDGQSKYRLLHNMYLIDWKSSIVSGQTITDANWIVCSGYLSPSNYSTQALLAIFTSKNISDINCGKLVEKLTKEQKDVVEFVLEKNTRLKLNKLYHLVACTYPCMTLDKGNQVDLPALAKNYINNFKIDSNDTRQIEKHLIIKKQSWFDKLFNRKIPTI